MKESQQNKDIVYRMGCGLELEHSWRRNVVLTSIGA